METIRNWFKTDTINNGQPYEINEYEGHFEARTNLAFFLIVEPHSGTNNKWMLRVAPISSFDRWANSTAVEEFFLTDIEVCNYLHEHQLDIYKSLLECLSNDYEEIYTNGIDDTDVDDRGTNVETMIQVESKQEKDNKEITKINEIINDWCSYQ